MEPLLKIVEEVDENKMEMTPPKSDNKIVLSKRRNNLVFRDLENASPRLSQFNIFCLQNKNLLNKLVKVIYSAGSKD